MAWYVNHSGKTVGPVEDAQILAWILEGHLPMGHVCAVGSQHWVDLAGYAPFAAALLETSASPPAAPLAHAGEGLGHAILLFPFGATFLIWLWVGNMNLLQDPASSLSVVGIATIVATAVLIAIEASQLGMGSLPVENGKKGSGPAAWFVASLLMWILAFPLYLSKRRWYGKRSLAIGGVLVALVFVASWAAMGATIETRKSAMREQQDETQRQGQRAVLGIPAASAPTSSADEQLAMQAAHAAYLHDREVVRKAKPKTEDEVTKLIGRPADNMMVLPNTTMVYWYYQGEPITRDVLLVMIQDGKITGMNL